MGKRKKQISIYSFGDVEPAENLAKKISANKERENLERLKRFKEIKMGIYKGHDNKKYQIFNGKCKVIS